MYDLPESFNTPYGMHEEYHSSEDWDFQARENLDHEDLTSVIVQQLNKRKPR